MQRTCGSCGFVNIQHAGAAVCPKCMRAYRATTTPASRAADAAADDRRPVLRKLGGVVLVLAAVIWVVARVSNSMSERAERERVAAIDAERDRQQALELSIAQGKVRIGMRADDVRAAWGQPTSINTTTSGSGTQEQWVYRWSNSAQQFVYLSNGVVRSIQTLGN